MVVRVARLLEHTVDVQGIRLVAVVVPARRGGHHHGVAVLKGFILNMFVLLQINYAYDGYLLVPQLVHGRFLGVVAAGKVLHKMEGTVIETPMAIPGTQLADVRIPVKDPTAGSARHIGELTGADAAEAAGKALRRPGQVVRLSVTGIHHRHNGLPDRLQAGFLLMRQGKGQQGKTIVQLGGAAVNLPAGEALLNRRETAFRTAGKGNALIFVLQHTLQGGITSHFRTVNAREEGVSPNILNRKALRIYPFFRKNLIQPQYIFNRGRDKEDTAEEIVDGIVAINSEDLLPHAFFVRIGEEGHAPDLELRGQERQIAVERACVVVGIVAARKDIDVGNPQFPGHSGKESLTLGKVTLRHKENVGIRFVAARINALDLCRCNTGHDDGHAQGQAFLGYQTGVAAKFGPHHGCITRIVRNPAYFFLQIGDVLVYPLQFQFDAFPKPLLGLFQILQGLLGDGLFSGPNALGHNHRHFVGGGACLLRQNFFSAAGTQQEGGRQRYEHISNTHGWPPVLKQWVYTGLPIPCTAPA